jgi:hypothetical protein
MERDDFKSHYELGQTTSFTEDHEDHGAQYENRGPHNLGANTDDSSQEASNRKVVALGSFMMMEFGVLGVRVSNAVGRGNKEDAGHA